LEFGRVLHRADLRPESSSVKICHTMAVTSHITIIPWNTTTPPMPTTAQRDPLRTCTRTRTGCWTCRARKKKCDETRPHCQTCCSLDLACEGYGIRLKWAVRGRSRVTFQHKSPGREKLEGKSRTPTSHPASGPVTPINNSTEHDSLLLRYLGQEVFDSLSEFERRLLCDCKALLPSSGPLWC
jgi:hypothetical protein